MDIYCVDTSSFIEMKDKYPQDTFPSVWKNIDKLCKEGRLIAPIEVKREIEHGDDELKRWAKRNKNIFIKPDKSQSEKMKEVLIKYPFLAKSQSIGPNADPWLIALVLTKSSEETLFSDNHAIVTEESKTKMNRIPVVCM